VLAGTLASLAALTGLAGLARALAGSLATASANQVVAAGLAGALAALTGSLAGSTTTLATHHVITTGVAARAAHVGTSALAGGTTILATCAAVTTTLAFGYSHIYGYVFHLLYPSLLFFHAEHGGLNGLQFSFHPRIQDCRVQRPLLDGRFGRSKMSLTLFHNNKFWTLCVYTPRGS